MNGHNSHLNMKFINTTDRLRILFTILLLHSIHRLQSLDVDLFSLLTNYYI